jgi:O-antigen/teichoic acid export membrane protein
MSRHRRALISAAFTHGQWALSIITSLVVTRLLLQQLGRTVYGMWTASAALIACAGFAELGLFAVLPWMIAEFDGKQDTTKIRALLAQGLILGLAVSALFLAAATALYLALPHVLHLGEADVKVLAGPLTTMVVLSALLFPLKVFNAVLTGLQDVSFVGTLGVLQVTLGMLITFGLTWLGHGLYGLALGSVLPSLVGSLLAFWRTVARRPDLLRDWRRPRWVECAPLVSGGLSGWMGTVGWQLAASMDGVILGHIGSVAMVPVFAITARLGLTLMQIAWTLPDSALVGLAQLKGEGAAERIREVVSALIRLHLLTAGGIVLILLSVNSMFVRIWVGPALFGGTALNIALALNVVVTSLVHSLIVPVAVLGIRVPAGLATLLNGLVHVALAVPLGRLLGLPGIALATFISALVTTFPVGMRLIQKAAGVSWRRLLGEAVLPWLVRCAPLAVLALWLGAAGASLNIVVHGALAACLGLVYLWLMRPIYRHFPFGPRLRRSLQAVRLVPRTVI